MISWISKRLGFAYNILVYGCVTHCTFEYLGDFVVCNGPSMEPTLYSNDILLTERISAKLSKVSKGDIIIAKCPTNPRIHVCKRVAGVAGDKISIQAINSGKVADGSISSDVITYVPKGQVWLEGDNKFNSTDSRNYGPVPEGLVKSRVLCRLWPLNEVKVLT